jgi:hypothetical protein
MPAIPRLRRGEPITAEFLNRLAEACEAGFIKRVVGGTLRAGGGGQTLAITPQLSRGGARAAWLPFQLVAWATDGANPQPRVRIIASTLQGAATGLPTGFDQDPDGTSWLGEPSAGTRYLFLKAISSGGSYSSSSIIDNATDSLTAGDGEAVALLGSYTYETGANGSYTLKVQNFGYGPATLSICRRAYTTPAAYDAWLELSGASNV